MLIQSGTNANWTLLQRILFRFAFIFLLLFIAFINNAAYPFWDLIIYFPDQLLHRFIPWFGKNILHLSEEINSFAANSGDTRYNYVLILCMTITSLTGTIIWSFLDRNRKNYERLYYWLTVAVRYYLALTMISYGFIKIFKLQFPAPGPYRLTETYGESSPMALAWTFLGFSKGYNVFMGIAEMAGILLLFRRTTTFGALICLGTTANVMAINYCYDVPVKVIATALFVMSLFLLLRDMRKLSGFFFSGKPVALQPVTEMKFKRKWLQWSKVIFKYLLIVFVLGFGTFQFAEYASESGDLSKPAKLYGLYETKLFVKGNDTLPAFQNNSRWKEMTVEKSDFAYVRFHNAPSVRYYISTDTLAKKIDLNPYENPELTYSFSYELKPKELVLKGKDGNDSLTIVLDRKAFSRDSFLLMNRGFHWVNEHPYNR